MENKSDDLILPVTSVTSGEGQEVLPDLYCLPVQIVNVCYIGDAERGGVLVDAAMPRSAETLMRGAEERFGGMKPRAIILTHGHFDHVGAIVDLVKKWGVPVYAHELELPYLTGKADYPPADPTVDGGMVTELSPLFPNEGINLEGHVHALPADGTVPELPEWRWIHTPGHTPGHISLFRERDRALIAGDAFVTVKQESLYKVITQEQEISGPPKYFTTDWAAAKASVRALADLRPLVAITGHGIPMTGDELLVNLERLAADFDTIAVPEHGRYVD
ncbi:metallo-beta-lactamase family protein [Paenibacillus swuensis]|uniref:Metallo-beta-lactamase family protein n=1 Tax=Paenibacillus swuensis TaxID=1178515 RepID=A0A172TFD7_9BACL|nr:MBL fold metallo-hydrolase [Paenibacillus swuensis]ANE45672.1 metallo-beta-lactamase family protein [Paenibacillus swuensis]